jgi:hypothetical protein
MHTLVDFMTHVKGIEYILSILFIAGFLLFWEILKPRPFATVASTSREDLNHLKQTGYQETMKSIKKIAAAPFIGLLYVAILPVGFFFVLLSEAVTLGVKAGAALLGRNVSFEWRPMEAYLAGKKKKKAGTKAESK